jgi:hypothetical protein
MNAQPKQLGMKPQLSVNDAFMRLAQGKPGQVLEKVKPHWHRGLPTTRRETEAAYAGSRDVKARCCKLDPRSQLVGRLIEHSARQGHDSLYISHGAQELRGDKS